MLARSINMATNELGWKTMVREKFIEVQVRRLLPLELANAQRTWEVVSKIEENHVGHDVNEAVLR